MRKSDMARMTEYFSEIREVRHFEINSSVMTAQSRRRLYWTNIPHFPLPPPYGIQVADILQDPEDVDKDLFLSTNQVITPKDIYTQGNWDDPHKMVRIFDIGTGRQGERIYSKFGKSVNITSSGGGPGGKTGMYLVDAYGEVMTQEEIQANSRRLTAMETERLQGIPDDYTKFDAKGGEITRTQRQRMVGNGFTIPIVAHILSPIAEDYRSSDDMDYERLSCGY
jgi:DNA (cytosine-5)-methyltransferase 3A